MDHGDAVEAEGFILFAVEEGKGQVDALDLAKPAFFLSALAAGMQVGFDLAAPVEHLRIDAEHGAADACAPAQVPDAVRTVELPTNVGIPEGSNIGAANVKGDLLFFFDNDAVLPSRDILARLAAEFDPRRAYSQPRFADPSAKRLEQMGAVAEALLAVLDAARGAGVTPIKLSKSLDRRIQLPSHHMYLL